jgi:hypothetical protein
MGFEIPGFKLGTQVANAALPNRYRFATLTTAGKIAQVSTAGGKAVGVIQSPAAADEAVELTVTGVSKVEAGAAIANTGPISSDAQGRAITAATGNAINGIALETAAAAGEVIAVLLGYGGAQA